MNPQSSLLILAIFSIAIVLYVMLKKNKDSGYNTPMNTYGNIKNTKNHPLMMIENTDMEDSKKVRHVRDEKIDLTGKNQVLVHKFILEKLNEIENMYYGRKEIQKPFILQEYSSFTVNKKIKKEVNYFVGKILRKLNKDTKLFFELDKIDYVNKKINKDTQDTLYYIDCFVHDRKNFVSKKLVFEIYYCENTRKMHVNYITYSQNNFLKNKVYKPRNSQIDFVNNTDTNDILYKIKQQDLYNDDMDIKDYGYKQSGTHYQLHPNEEHNSLIEPSEKRNKIIEPPVVQMMHDHGFTGWPNNELSRKWDKNGILEKVHKTKLCVDNYNTSCGKRPIDLKLQPGFAQL